MKDMSYPLPAAGAVPAASSRHAVTLLFRERHAELVRLAVLLLGSRPAAEDVVQDVFTRLCTRDYLAAGGNPLAYVRTAVVNGCRSALRRTSAAGRAGERQTLLTPVAAGSAGAPSADDLANATCVELVLSAGSWLIAGRGS